MGTRLRKCPKCKFKSRVPDGEKFCPKCGAPYGSKKDAKGGRRRR